MSVLTFYRTSKLCKPEDVLYHITVFSKPTDMVTTTRGQMSYKQWLEEVELPRFVKRGWPVDLVANKIGEICLVHLRVKAR